MSTQALEAHPTISKRRKAVVASVLGNALENYDFVCYAYFAVLFAHNFFPAEHSAATSLVGTFAIFGVGLIARPLGALFFGRLGDVKGRKLALMIAMPMMGLGTLMMGLLPTYAQIGITAPILLVVFRLIQGFSQGGECGNAISFLIEWAPPKRRALYSCLQQASAVGGTLFGSILAAGLSTLMDHASLEAWGWRIPFLIGGLVITPISYYLRSHVDESPIFETARPASEAESSPSAPESVVLLCVRTLGITTVWVVAFYIFLSYLPSFLTVHGHISSAGALWVNTAGLLAMLISIVTMAVISDRIGRKPLLAAGATFFLLFAYPMFQMLVNLSSIVPIFTAIVLCGIVIGLFAGVCPAAMAEIFPTRMRSTGVSIGFNLSTAIFGGFAPLISEFLIKFTGSQQSPSYYVIFAAAISLVAIASMKETAHKPLS
ncbi:MFS transporter [Paraburkholderia aromaticivorans]|uniref:MFS transporter n=1 Tax=Paraburkholderia aromaticivorans TaxID=2026199 RepID=UPI001456194C|nr:MFS transporter [Paraburkholderia aromaticivorans]